MNFWKFTNKPQHMNRNLQPAQVPTQMPGQAMMPGQQPQAQDVMDINAQQIQNMPNPFQDQNFQNPLPDIPIQDQGAAMLNALLSDDGVPNNIRKDFWFVFHRDNVLTFLDTQRKASKLLGFDIMKIDVLNATPYYEYTFDVESKWTASRNILETKLDRALGNKKGQNERLTIPLTVTENINRMEDQTTNANKEGFLKKLLNRR